MAMNLMHLHCIPCGELLFVIRTDPSLHQPMYYFLPFLSVSGLGLSLSTMPTVMSIFWDNYRKISFDICFAQGYFIHSFSFLEPSALLAMAFDRCVATCCLLRYSSILTLASRIGLAALCRCLLSVLPSLFLLRRLPFCRSHLLSHAYCLHQDLIKLVSADIAFNRIYTLAVVILIAVLDPLLIVSLYIMICKTVLSTASQKECLQVLNIFQSHILAILTVHIPTAGLTVVHHFRKHTSPLIHVLMAITYLLVPTLLNSTIYSIKTKQICRESSRW
ncbi:LOW QUALITY PROTEIN: olfactory receptor 51Q1-like [Numida meleagris]|uniref:LOW QUALITY PROTEIN: olfactory receptor 51Q1-like n=1 Tax=Numida meleagris TaxID=8996 RepID=UPI000B3D929A|nr:LOW QUALITY PROTEIN: olfactory receptor 51Q1-like [Numida meleagris]